MTPEHWERVSSIWHAVLERPQDERGAAVDELCNGDEPLRRDVESLLAHLARADAAGFGTPATGAPPVPIAPGTSLGPYQVRDQIGAGGMGVVYRARDPRLGRDVAIKVLPMDVARDPERLRRFEQEARSAAALNHPNIVAVYDIGLRDGAPYIVSELLDGATLRERLNESRASGLPLRKAVDCAVQIARGLAAAHEKGIVHRDLKPENVFVTTDGHSKILDFGLAKLTEPDGRASHGETAPTGSSGTQPGMVMGTAGYMAPEQVRGLPTDERADIFAFGATLYEMLAGQRAFRGETAMDTLSAILTEEPPALSSSERRVPPSLALIVHRCLEKAPGARFQTASDLAFALEALSGSAPALPAAGGETAGRGRTVRWVVGLALTAATVLGIVVMTRPKTPPRSDPAEHKVDSQPTPPPENEEKQKEEPVRGEFKLLPPAPPPAPLEPVFLSFNLPTGTQLTNRARQVITITPDGKRVVFVANRTLWVRRLDTSEEAKPIEGISSPNVTTPFASPDGEQVGFFQGRALWIIPLDGGVPQLVCQTQTDDANGANWGASWGQDSQIVFALQDGVYAVPAKGGMQKQIVKVARPEAVYGPQMLPDGDHLLMTITTATSGARWDDAQIVVQSVKTGKRKMLVQRGRDARYLDTGHLVYAVGTTLYAVAFNTSSLQVGQPKEMEKGVRAAAIITGASFFAVSQKGHLVYAPTIHEESANSMALVDLNGNATPLPFPLDAERPRFSPDGSRFLALPRDDQDRALWVYSTGGSEDPRKVPGSNRASLQGAIWERDGAITFSAGDHFVRVPDGGKGVAETLATSGGSPIGWSLDGETFYHGGQKLWTWRRGQEHRPFQELETFKSGASLSPDGKWIAYWTNAEKNAGTGVYILSTASPNNKHRIGTGHHPVWHPDGEHIFFIDGTTLVMVEVHTSPFSVGAPKTIQYWVAQDNRDRNYDVGRDGRLIVELLEGRGQSEASRIEVVLNWTTKLRRIVPSRQ